ncbi:aromatic ring-hydroxylating oxygenase subunit alpha [Sphingomonas profundi]|uniref:aromatic ring-hydroxylating oxygenase subunit alpha n=1 Tax=Alterirhizorhabdus profundi TaxID=2681549 RepID=UPI0012E979CC|nr:aromatic ring-hydroxylating dioxygenase subunit alpha [Sphingomonas profundi]
MTIATSRPASRAEHFVREVFPRRKAGALTRDRYVSRDYAEREFERVFARHWLVTGRTGEIPEAGDYYTFEIGRESILVVRQQDGGVRAFYNVCQHRGNRLVRHREGSQPSFTCDYHSWRWGIDGTLEAVQDEGDFSQGSPCGRLRLAELRCETFKSFVFVNMDAEAPSLREALGQVWDDWQPYPIEQMVRVQALTVNLPSNWKGLIDNFSEVYHFATVHAPFLDFLEDDFRDIECDVFDEGHTRLRMKAGLPSTRHIDSGRPVIGPQLAAELMRWGLDPAAFADRPRDTRAALQEAKRRLGPARGHDHYAAMSDSQLTDSHHYVLFPNFAAGLLADGLLFHRLRPHADDPNRCHYDVHYYAFGNDAFGAISTAAGSAEGREDVPVETVDYGERSLGALLDGDVDTMRTQQQGWRSRGYAGGELSDQEFRVAWFHHVLDRAMAGA